jgi:uncharacterized hydantoinase/oxoprolinase family protein
MERGELREKLRERLKVLERLKPRSARDLLQASRVLQLVERDVEDYAVKARHYELLNPLKQIESCESALYATYATIALNGGGEEIIERARKDLKEAIKALREILARL